MLTLCPECSARVPLRSGVGPVGAKVWTCPEGHTWGHEGRERRHYARMAHLAEAAHPLGALCELGGVLIFDAGELAIVVAS